jgi:hypothetical protein
MALYTRDVRREQLDGHVPVSLGAGKAPAPQISLGAVKAPSAERMTWLELCQRALAEPNAKVPNDPRDVLRAALSDVRGVSAIQGVVNAAILQGFADERDTTAGWVRVVNLPSFTTAQLGLVDEPPRFGPVPRGAAAPVVSFGVSSQGWRLAKFGCQFTLDESDLLNGESIGLQLVAYRELGAAARRVAIDLVYSVLLENPVLDDGSALFAVGRGNYATAALADTSLDAGIGAVINQVREDEDGSPIHRGLNPRYLVVPGQLVGAARRLVSDMAAGDDGGLIVRGESRLSAAGLIDPRDPEVLRSGSTTNWLLACPQEQAAGIVLGALSGNLNPRIRTYELDQGEWGLGWDVSLPLACAALDGQALYFSTGAA